MPSQTLATASKACLTSPMERTTDHTSTERAAVDWLLGRLRWEQVLSDLHDRAEGDAPVAPLLELPDRSDDAAA